jgi:cytoskeletal protein RodZ
MSREFLHLGESFKKKREEKGLSLKEVENATSIRLHYLAAIEGGHLGKLISPIYAQGFIKKYAAFLDLDAENLLKTHPQVMEMLTLKTDEKEEFAFGVGTLEVRGTLEKNEINWLPSLLWIGLSALILTSCWFLIRYFEII